MTNYPAWAAGQRVTAAALVAGQSIDLVKAGDTQRASNTTVTADPDLAAPVEANATYVVEGLLIYGADPAADMKLGFTGPTSAVFNWNITGPDGSQTGTSTPVIVDAQAIGTSAFILGGVTNNAKKMIGKLRGTLTTGSTPGTFAYVWAQQTSSANATIMYAGSTMTLRRIA